MPHRLSPRESRRLLRQFLRQEEPVPGEEMRFAGVGARRREPAPALPGRATGPYELAYPISDGYTTARTVLVP